jgi:CRP-like cAMP-binding protein
MTLTTTRHPEEKPPVTPNQLETAGYEGLYELGQTRCLRRGETLFHEGDSLQYHYVILEGAVRLFRQSAEGKSFTFSILAPYKIFGGADIFGDSSADLSAEALIDSRVLLLERSIFRQYVDNHPGIYASMMMDAMERITSMEQSLLDFMILSSEGRLARTLWQMCEQFGREIPLSHDDIANITGCCREYTSNLLRDLQESGVLETGRQRIVILDKELLREIVKHSSSRLPMMQPRSIMGPAVMRHRDDGLLPDERRGAVCLRAGFRSG